MQETTYAVLRAIMLDDPTLAGSERRALQSFLETKHINVVVAEGALLLNASKAAEFLGVSTDTFKRIRDQAARRGIKDLCGVEVTPGNFMFPRVALVRFSQGEFGLDWPSAHSDTPVLNFTHAVSVGGKAAV